MGVYSKDSAGNLKKIAGNIVQRLNTRWFLCTRSIENGTEYYTVPQSAQTYFKTIDPYTIYSFGFNEPNMTNTPKLRYGNVELEIHDFTNESNGVMIGQLSGVFQMFTQDLATEPKMYFAGNTHRDLLDTEMSDVSTNSVQNKVIKSYIDEQNIEYIGREQQVDFNATLSGNIITAELDETVRDFEFKHNTRYLIHIYLPLVTLTGDLDNGYSIIIKDKNNNDININCITQTEFTKTSTVGDLCQIQRYDTAIGYSWTFSVLYKEIVENGQMIRSMYTDVITRETNPSMTGANFANLIANNKLKVGSTVLVTTDYSANGVDYKAGNTYKVTGEWVTDELITSAEELSGSSENPLIKVNGTTEASAIGENNIAIGNSAETSNEYRQGSNSIAIGNGARTYHNDAISIGTNAHGESGYSYSIAIGGDAYARRGISIGKASSTYDGVTIGYLAKGTADNAIQLGSGTNSIANSFQVGYDNIYKTNTHTLTVQNAEVNSFPVYGILQGTVVPTTAIVGEVGQFYLDTETKKLYQCKSINTTVTPNEYEWVEVGGGADEELRNNTVQIVGTDDSLLIGGARISSSSSHASRGSIAIGKNAFGGSGYPDGIAIGTAANAVSGVSIGRYASSGLGGTAIGPRTSARGRSIAIGDGKSEGAKTVVEYCIQIGGGENNTAYTAQFGGKDDPINSLSIYQDADHATDGVAGYKKVLVEGEGGGLPVLTGTDVPTRSTVGELGQLYIETTINNEIRIWQCIYSNHTDSSYLWTNPAGASLYPEEEYGFIAGGGWSAQKNSIAIGHSASASRKSCIQLGQGTNTRINSLQIFNDNIYKHDTHTLTVQNAEVNSNPVYGILQGTTAPTTETIGSVSQFYLDTATKKLYQCVEVTTDETAGTSTYSWQMIGSSSETYEHNIRWKASDTNIDLTLLNNNPSPINTVALLSQELYNQGFTSSDLAKHCSGNLYNAYIIYGIFSSGGNEGVRVQATELVSTIDSANNTLKIGYVNTSSYGIGIFGTISDFVRKL